MTLIAGAAVNETGGLYPAEIYRQAAIEAAEAAVRAVIQAQASDIRGDETSESSRGVVVFDDAHSGDVPIQLDAEARQAAWTALQARLGSASRALIEAGEEAGVATRVLRPGDLIARLDALDGSTNAGSTMANWSSVALIDEVRSTGGPGARARHHAGCIATASGWSVSWVNESRFDHDRQRYNKLVGRVCMSASVWGVPEIELRDTRWNRRKRSFAAVASKIPRLDALLDLLNSTGPDDLIYNIGGTPIVTALLVGQLENVIEPEHVTLHDSAHLIPHQLLGGSVNEAATGQPLDYIGLYERNAVDLSPSAKPVPPYWARGGVAD